MNNPRTSKTFRECCRIKISEKVERISNTVERVDIVFDFYRKASRKRKTREGRGKNEGVRISIKKKTPVYRKCNQVLEVSGNKTELFLLVADTSVENFQHKQGNIVATKGESVVSNHHIETKYCESCKKEEADGRIFLHALEMSRLGLTKLLIVTADTDVVVIALYALWDFDLEKLWIEFGREKDCTWLPVHAYAKALGEEICRAVLFWYAFTGCGTVFQFLGKEKKQHGIPGENFWRQQRHLSDFHAYQNLQSPTSRL